MDQVTNNPPSDTQSSNQSLVMKSLVGIISLTVVSAAGYYYFINSKPVTPPQTPPTQAPLSETQPASTQPPASVPKLTYKNGTYTKTGSYKAPSGTETVMVSVTLLDDKITASTFKGDTQNQASKKFQAQFSSGFTEQVVGKSIDEVALTIVNGSSLTPIGFMEALKAIKTEAKG